ncbi:MAG: extracellular solute-binding protein [Spirochaetes bacterium]|nr:extracellular solute-binding protein [Brevinematales bacterium]MCL1959786.1 extracellular solute-binding protein [Spirochaetota bacterium]
MKRLIKTLSVCLLVLMLVLTVSCTKKESKTPDKLTFWVYDTGRTEVLNELGKKFQAEFGVAVEISTVDLGQIRNQFLLASGGEECADIAIIPHDNLGALVENGMVTEINLGSKKSSFLEPALDGFNYNGKLYGVPLAVENIGFFYNTSMMSAPPETWDEAVTIAENLIKAGKAEVMMGLPDATYNAYPVYDGFGGAIFGKKADGSLDGKQVLMAEPGFVAGLEFLTAQVKKKLIPENIDWDGAHVLFESGKAPYCMTGPWALNRFKEAKIPYAVAKFPSVKKGGPAGNPFLGVQGMIISSVSPRKLLAQSFAVDFMAREENFKAIFQAEGRPSAWKSVFDAATDSDTRGFNAAGVKAVPMPSIPEMGYVWDAWVAAAALAFSGERSPADALRNAKAQIEAVAK